MNSESGLTLKEKLGTKLMNFPMLRQLLFEFWFRVVFFLFLLGGVFLSLFVPKIWTASPPEFLPVIKISGLDVLQAWSLKRTALKAMAAGNDQEAFHAWQAAVANNPADPNLHRGALQHGLESKRSSQRYLEAAVGQTAFLLRLTRTNEIDLALATQVYEKYQLHDWVIELLTPYKKSLRPPLDGAYLKALFHMDQMDEFANVWGRMGLVSQTNRELVLFHDAFLAGWGPPETAAEAKRHLEEAIASPDLAILASRLQMAVSARRNDPEGYRVALGRIEERQQETLLDRIGYWRLLVFVGRKAEAKELAQAYAHPPTSPLEVLRLASVYGALGMTNYTLQFVDRSLSEFGYAAHIWLLYAQLLMEEKRWEELANLPLRIRQQPRLRDVLAGYSYYLEGRAELARGRTALAKDAFQKASQLSFEIGSLGLSTAAQLAQLGYPTEARDILLHLEKRFEDNPNYWNVLCLAAHGVRQPELMLKAAQKAFGMQPANGTFANNYAAALLYNRQRPEEAVKLTLQVVTQAPGSVSARINHILALLLSQRVEDAEKLLRTIDRENLTAQELTSVDLAWFEVYFRQKRYAQAQQAGGRINREYLFPTQLKWLDQTTEEMDLLRESKS